MTDLKNNWLLPSVAGLLLWGGWSFLPKLAMRTISPHSVLFYEAVGDVIFVALPIFFFLKGKLQTNREGVTLAACSSSISLVSLLIYYYALRVGPVATISTIGAMYPVVALILARIFLQEKINRLQCLAIVMALTSIYLLAVG